MAPGLDRQARLTVGATTYLATGGAGAALLLLHGFLETHVCWQRIALALAASHSIVAPDLKGCGASEAALVVTGEDETRLGAVVAAFLDA